MAETDRSKPNEAGSATSELASVRRPEGLEWRAHEAKRSAQSKAAKRLEARGHAQRASAAPEHRAAVREAKGRLGPGNLEGEARKYAGPYPRAAKGECAGETGEGGAKMQDDHCELWGACSPVHQRVKKTFLTRSEY